MAPMFMSGDLGGTNFRISLFECDGPLAFVPAGAACPGKLLHHSRFRTADYDEFSGIIGDFLAECKAQGIEGTPTTGCFSCAGPVQPNNTVRMTNIQRWPEIDGDALAERYGISGGVKLINDFVAAGYGLLTLGPGTRQALRLPPLICSYTLISSCRTDDYIVLQEGDAQPNAPVACIGAGARPLENLPVHLPLIVHSSEAGTSCEEQVLAWASAT